MIGHPSLRVFVSSAKYRHYEKTLNPPVSASNYYVIGIKFH